MIEAVLIDCVGVRARFASIQDNPLPTRFFTPHERLTAAIIHGESEVIADEMLQVQSWVYQAVEDARWLRRLFRRPRAFFLSEDHLYDAKFALDMLLDWANYLELSPFTMGHDEIDACLVDATYAPRQICHQTAQDAVARLAVEQGLENQRNGEVPAARATMSFEDFQKEAGELIARAQQRRE